MATSLDKSEKQGPDLSPAAKALSDGEKVAKISPVYPEIFNEIRHVILDFYKWTLSTLELLNRISQNFHTIYEHHMRC